MSVCIQIDPADNTAVLLEDAAQGEVLSVLSTVPGKSIIINEAVPNTHKVALVDIARGAVILKYGVSIGHATQEIKAGDWVHLHNLASDFDERSGTLELHSGFSTDMSYE